MNLITSHDRIEAEISAYWQTHNEYPDPLGAWEAFKAFLKGIFIAEVDAIKHNTRAQSERAAWLVCSLEAEFISDSSDAKREAWMAAQAAVDRLATSTADRKRFFNKLAF